MRDKILELRGDGRSGAEIKEYIESMITFEVPATGELKAELKSMRDLGLMLSREAAKKDNTPERNAYLKRKEREIREKEHDLHVKLTGESKIHVDGKVIDRDLISEGVLTDDGKLKLNAQTLVDWAKARGVGATKKRKTVKTVEAEAKKVFEEKFNQMNENLSRVKVENKDLKEQLDKERRSNIDSNEIRSKLRNENYILREKLKVC